MTKPIYGIRLTGEELTQKINSCTGEQLCMILNILCINEENAIWSSSDVTTSPTRKNWSLYASAVPIIVGDSTKLLELCQQVEQFTSGVFLAVYDNNNSKSWARPRETEDAPFIDNEFADVEIRAFDTSYFEIYSKKISVLTCFINRFGCELTVNKEGTNAKNQGNGA